MNRTQRYVSFRNTCCKTLQQNEAGELGTPGHAGPQLACASCGNRSCRSLIVPQFSGPECLFRSQHRSNRGSRPRSDLVSSPKPLNLPLRYRPHQLELSSLFSAPNGFGGATSESRMPLTTKTLMQASCQSILTDPSLCLDAAFVSTLQAPKWFNPRGETAFLCVNPQQFCLGFTVFCRAAARSC
jgi:hypothetical protein